jgi:2-polyprenyl-3-methyl-5-hydroxy-6-metoxy-1,4-benzoquinol methylase
MDDSEHALYACRICGCKSLLFHFEVAGQKLWQCPICGFVQVEHEPSPEVFNSIYSEDYFTSAKYQGDQVALNQENGRRLRLLRRWSSIGSEVLDAGCSTGDFVAYAKGEYQMYGLDYSSFAIETARANNPELAHKLKSGRVEETEWADKLFDAICLWDVIEHIWDPVSVIRDLLSRVRPGGLVLISTPAIDSLNAKIAGRYWPFMTPPEHLSFFSLLAFKMLVTNLGNCEIVYTARRGKWANVSFIAYKVMRIAPSWFPKSLLWPCFQWPFKLMSIYVPTGDILYVVLRKKF